MAREMGQRTGPEPLLPRQEQPRQPEQRQPATGSAKKLTKDVTLATLKACTMAASRLSRQIHRKGYRIRFAMRPRLVTPEEAAKHAAPEDKTLHEKWIELVRKGQAQVITDGSPGFYSRSFTIPKKKKGEWRLISDLMAVVDIQDGYFNVPMGFVGSSEAFQAWLWTIAY